MTREEKERERKHLNSIIHQTFCIRITKTLENLKAAEAVKSGGQVTGDWCQVTLFLDFLHMDFQI